MRVFLSWSGPKSRAFAEALRDWLPRVLDIEPWMSAEDIGKGERWADILGRTLEEHDVGILCVTPENSIAPWLLFEAGALSKSLSRGRLFPLLLGMSPTELTGPLSGFQATVLERADMAAMMRSLAKLAGKPKESIVDDRFNTFWPRLADRAEEISRMVLPGESATITNVVSAFARHGLPEPAIGSQVNFSGSFESHALYEAVTSIAAKRLWLLGRKNRKLFDKEHKDFIAALPKLLVAGFDFRVLFLSAESPSHILDSAHADPDFANSLRVCHDRAVRALREAGIDPAKHCRTYAFTRTVSCVIVDDAVIYSPIQIDAAGRALPLTKTPFSVVNSGSPLGQMCERNFETYWEQGTPMQ